MPQLGDVAKGIDLGYKTPGFRYILLACKKCGKQRWVRLVKTRPDSSICVHCNMGKKGNLCGKWKGGRCFDNGYVQLKLQPDDFFYPMAKKNGYVLEHRLVMAKHLGRCLQGWELVHHKNHIKTDNRIENLQLVTDDRHNQITILENRIKVLERRLTLLEAENVLLRIEG